MSTPYKLIQIDIDDLEEKLTRKYHNLYSIYPADVRDNAFYGKYFSGIRQRDKELIEKLRTELPQTQVTKTDTVIIEFSDGSQYEIPSNFIC